MSEITPRPIAKRDELPKFGRFLKGQQTHISGRSPLRCYYYNKQVRGRWSSAERSITGMRWNAYLVSGKSFPRFEPLAPQRMHVVKGLMKEIEAKPGKDKAASAELHGLQAKEKMRKSAEAEQMVPVEPRLLPISSHARFRHLHIVMEQEGKPAPVIGIRHGLPSTGECNNAQEALAHDSSGSAAAFNCTAEQEEVKPARWIGTIPQFQIINALDHIDHVEAEAGPGPREGGNAGAETVNGSPEPVAARSQTTREAQLIARISVLLTGHEPANDNFIPYEPGPAAAICTRFFAGAGFASSSIGQARSVGYISSRQRRAFQLKTAQGAALPQ